MSHIPMHNRFAEGFVESASSGETLDPLSSRIQTARPADAKFDEALHRARTARAAALAAALVRAGRYLAAAASAPVRALIERLAARRCRERAAVELYAVDDRTLADLGLRRADIPFLARSGHDRFRGNRERP